jgi:SAM-dependent MidA family methyltransferase
MQPPFLHITRWHWKAHGKRRLTLCWRWQVLESPGEVDLSAWVDFSSVRQAVVEEAGGEAVVHGPITQAHFLRSLGIDARLEALLPNASPKQAGRLKQGFARLVGSSGEGGLQDGMGSTYKAMVIAHKDLPTPVAFEPQTLEALQHADEQDDSPTSSR